MVNRSHLNAELHKMKELIRNDASVRSRFDIDGSGTVDGGEWDQVRQLVVQRLEHEEAEAAEARRLVEESGESLAAAATHASVGLVAEEILVSDLHPTAVGAPVSIDESNDIIVEQQVGLGQLFQSVGRRNYHVLARDGAVLGQILQVQNEMLLDATHKDPLSLPDLNFKVLTETGDVRTLRRSQACMDDRMEVVDPAGGSLGFVLWEPGFIERRYYVVSTMDPGALTVRTQVTKPFTLQVVDDDGVEVGTVSRRWSGLGGFLTGGNRLRILVTGRHVTPGQRWGLLAACLLEDLSAESRRDERGGRRGMFGG